MSCLVTAGKTVTCDTAKKIGGLNEGCWIFNTIGSDGKRPVYTEGANGEITDINVAIVTGKLDMT